jgi:hypothetical protein
MDESLLNNRKTNFHKKTKGGKKMKSKLAFSMLIFALMLSFLLVNNSFAEIEFFQLSNYDAAQHYTTSGEFPDDFLDDPATTTVDESKPDQQSIGALKRGADRVPIIKFVVTDAEGDATLRSVTFRYNGINVTDIESSLSLYEVTYDGNNLDTANLRKVSSRAGENVTFSINIAINQPKSFIVTLNISSSASSYNVDLIATGATGDNFTNTLINPDPTGEAQIDATAPTLNIVEYDKGTKVLTMTFADGGVASPRVNVIHIDDDDDTVFKVNLSKLRIQDQDDGNQISLAGVTFLYPDYVSGPTDDFEIPSSNADANKADANMVKLKLTSAQSADFENKFPDGGTRIPELDILAGALTDHVFGNSIAEDLNNPITITAQDNIPPKLLAAVDKPVKLNAETRELTLLFDEAVYGRDVQISRIYIMNY